MRGGVSDSFYVVSDNFSSSPHARGCFSVRMAVQPSDYVFPACAGVFPDQRPARSPARGLPRMRGGVFALLFLPARVHMHHAVLDRGEGGFDRLVDAFGD